MDAIPRSIQYWMYGNMNTISFSRDQHFRNHLAAKLTGGPTGIEMNPT